MFLGLELILYGFLIVFDLSWIKYLGIFICFLRLIDAGKGYEVVGMILMADALLLWSDAYEIGICLFICVQCFYHRMLHGTMNFSIFFLVLLWPHLYLLSLIYAMMSLINIRLAIQKHHWLTHTLCLLALCDLCVVFQFVTGVSIPAIWWFYLPSQVWYTKKILSNEERTIVKVNQQ